MGDGLFGRGEPLIEIPSIKAPKIGFHQLLVIGNSTCMAT